MKYACIDSQRDEYPLQVMCDMLGVSTSGYADWKKCGGLTHRLSDEQLLAVIRSVHAEFKQAYGSPRITDELKDRSIPVSRERVVSRSLTTMSKPEGLATPGQDWSMPADGPIDIQHIGGVTLIQASIRNLGTCRSDVKGEIQAESIRKDESTDAEHRGGDARSRDEGPVMGLDRRGVIVRRYCVGNLKEGDRRG